nr:hypothetical protein Iba_chr07bCG4220 [Ipomoea batatas]GMD17561.1 hypothetical protein Iba_chr07dCG4770 [Ipomoea batatas]GME07508.1 hypothetical protein Iba_scaffold6206CG0020 [Ipomoea batatas]
MSVLSGTMVGFLSGCILYPGLNFDLTMSRSRLKCSGSRPRLLT